jgi:glycosyltransferase involved in cell wall biosynthesis
MVIVHLTASRFFGGPERQMLELACALPPHLRTVFVSFSEGNLCHHFLREVRAHGFDGIALTNDTPYFRALLAELTTQLRQVGTTVLCCHGYKADILGYLAARRLRLPVVGVSRGWTAENLRVRLYEMLDRRVLPWMNRVVCVSAGQAVKVRRAGVSDDRITVIHNAIRAERFTHRQSGARALLESFFARPCQRIVGAAGRLSPEKGFEVLVDAAALMARRDTATGFVLFGDGALRETLQRRIERAGLAECFVLAGFRDDLDTLIPAFDVLALPSYTEGLPNVVLEAFAAAVPVVATAVGGTPELIDDGVNGFLVPAGDAAALGQRLSDVLSNEAIRKAMGEAGRQRVRNSFTFAAQAQRYGELFEELTSVHRGTAKEPLLQEIG